MQNIFCLPPNTNDSTRYCWVYILKIEDEVFEKFLEWKTMIESESGHKIKTLRSDKGGEYTSKFLKNISNIMVFVMNTLFHKLISRTEALLKL